MQPPPPSDDPPPDPRPLLDLGAPDVIYPDVRDLICEGHCNPRRLVIDFEVRELRRKDVRAASGGVIAPLVGRLVDNLRTLKYTPHERRREGLWVCQTCGTGRRY